MDFLLDTHTFLWFINGDELLSAPAKNAILSPDSTKYLSIASLWEIAIKVNIGKLELDMPYKKLRTHISENGFELLPITFEHTLALSTLELYHRDPFDRIIIVQAMTEKFRVISLDKNFSKYKGLQVLW